MSALSFSHLRLLGLALSLVILLGLAVPSR
jgi:hypothetical protein